MSLEAGMRLRRQRTIEKSADVAGVGFFTGADVTLRFLPAPEHHGLCFQRIDLPDASVDRVISFHAFHHVPNHDDVIGEFARILRPGGIAGFVEPGPRHSETPDAQFEMRTYGVIERDIDIHAIWRTAQRAGFSALELAVWHAPLFHLSLERYEDLFASSADGIAVVDADGQLLFANPRAYQLLNYPPDGFRGEKVKHLIDPEDVLRVALARE